MRTLYKVSSFAVVTALFLSTEFVFAQSPACHGSGGLRHCWIVADPDDIGIADSVFSGLDDVAEYVAAEYDSDTNLSVEETAHNIGKGFKVSLMNKKRGRYSILGYTTTYADDFWDRDCIEVDFSSDGGSMNATSHCAYEETIYSAKLTLISPVIKSMSERYGISIADLEKHVAMHEFYHGIGFMGHSATCERIIDQCNVFPLVLHYSDISSINSAYP